ncbi:unnamed protein product [Calypogeia fissa]
MVTCCTNFFYKAPGFPYLRNCATALQRSNFNYKFRSWDRPRNCCASGIRLPGHLQHPVLVDESQGYFCKLKGLRNDAFMCSTRLRRSMCSRGLCGTAWKFLIFSSNPTVFRLLKTSSDGVPYLQIYFCIDFNMSTLLLPDLLPAAFHYP